MSNKGKSKFMLFNEMGEKISPEATFKTAILKSYKENGQVNGKWRLIKESAGVKTVPLKFEAESVFFNKNEEEAADTGMSLDVPEEQAQESEDVAVRVARSVAKISPYHFIDAKDAPKILATLKMAERVGMVDDVMSKLSEKHWFMAAEDVAERYVDQSTDAGILAYGTVLSYLKLMAQESFSDRADADIDPNMYKELFDFALELILEIQAAGINLSDQDRQKIYDFYKDKYGNEAPEALDNIIDDARVKAQEIIEDVAEEEEGSLEEVIIEPAYGIDKDTLERVLNDIEYNKLEDLNDGTFAVVYQVEMKDDVLDFFKKNNIEVLTTEVLV